MQDAIRRCLGYCKCNLAPSYTAEIICGTSETPIYPSNRTSDQEMQFLTMVHLTKLIIPIVNDIKIGTNDSL